MQRFVSPRTMWLRVLLLAVVVTSLAPSARAESPLGPEAKVIFEKTFPALGKADVKTIGESIVQLGNVSLRLRDFDRSASKSATLYYLTEFFKQFPPIGAKLEKMDLDAAEPTATGTFETASKEKFNVKLAVRKAFDKPSLSLIEIVLPK